MNICWCGSDKLNDYSKNYYQCSQCNTLITKENIENNFDVINDDENDFYGKTYWTEHVSKDYKLPDIYKRVRSDLPERCVYWLKHILKYKLPDLKTIELGCGNGGFVYLMEQAGYTSTGTELSPWICDFNKKTFDINMLCGKIEDLNISDDTYDIIICIDVLEHLLDPVRTIEILSNKLKDDGMLVIQTPMYNGKSFSQLIDEEDLFIQQLKEKEHTFLFNKENIRTLLGDHEFNHVIFEKALFPYDMFLFASKKELVPNEKNLILESLTKKSKGRMVLALLDLYDENDKLHNIELEANKRLNDVSRLTEQVLKLQKDYDQVFSESEKRLENINLLTEQVLKLQKDYDQVFSESEKRLADVIKLNNITHIMQKELSTNKETILQLQSLNKANKNKLLQLNNNKLIKLIRKIKKI